jgi:hypothetical protein
MTTTISAWCFRSSMNCWGTNAIVYGLRSPVCSPVVDRRP